MRVLIACGGTGGHLFPGLALIEELNRTDQPYKITVVVSAHPRDKQFLKAVYFPGSLVETICVSALPYRPSLRYVSFIFKLGLALLQSFYLLFKHRPEVVIGFGGYASFAPLASAWMAGIPTLIHEQNYRPGRANQWLAKIAKRVAISFNGSDSFFKPAGLERKIVHTGYPLRRRIIEYAAGSPQARTEKFTILISGGSQGAQAINKLTLNCWQHLEDRLKSQIQLIHLSGKRDQAWVKSQYAALGMDAQVFDFFADMAVIYAKANLLISRCGAGTIFEAASFGLPCLLIPHPYGTGHQQDNARYLQLKGAALVLEEQGFSCVRFNQMLAQLIEDQSSLRKLSQGIAALANTQAGLNLKKQIDDIYEAHYVCK